MPDTLAQCTGILLFRAIGRKIIKNVRQRESPPASPEEDEQFNTCDLCDSEDYFESACSKKEDDSGYDSNGQNSNEDSCCGTTSCSDDGKEEKRKSWKSLNVLYLASALQNLKLHVTKHKNKKPSKEPKSILRRPVRHVYIRGISGLPTRRVPVSMYYYRQPRPGARFYS